MAVIVTCKNEEDLIKNEFVRVVTAFYIHFLGHSRGAYSIVSDGIWPKTKLLRLSLLPARTKKINSKMKVLEWSEHFSPFKSMGIFPDAQGQLTPQCLVRSG